MPQKKSFTLGRVALADQFAESRLELKRFKKAEFSSLRRTIHVP
jgi:hypothetical protein